MFFPSKEQELIILHRISFWLVIYSLVVFILLHFIIPSPWGKAFDAKKYKWLGPGVDARLAWTLFESPNLVWAVICWNHRNKQAAKGINILLVSLFVGHYIRRAVIYPLLQMKPGSKPIPIMTVLAAFSFCSVNG
jgi:hypothetical protein